MFNECKAAQMAAWFIQQRGGRISHLKLMKLLYLADREAMQQHGFPISGDHFAALPHGPVLSQTLSLADGSCESKPGGWESWMSDKDNHEIGLRRTVSREVLDQLSDAELEVMQKVWAQFGRMTRWEIRDYTHQHCPEWIDPQGSSKRIPYRNVFKALGHDTAQAIELSARIDAEHRTSSLFAAL